MKKFFCPILFPVIGLLTGCALQHDSPTMGMVGPEPVKPAAPISTNGTLLVYSATEVNADFAARDPDHPQYSDYSIYTPAGQKLQRVHNNMDDLDQSVVPVTLPPGEYVIHAHANGYGEVQVPVLIAINQATVLHLEGGNHVPNTLNGNAKNFVRLPDGEIIGWRAND